MHTFICTPICTLIYTPIYTLIYTPVYTLIYTPVYTLIYTIFYSLIYTFVYVPIHTVIYTPIYILIYTTFYFLIYTISTLSSTSPSTLSSTLSSILPYSLCVWCVQCHCRSPCYPINQDCIRTKSSSSCGWISVICLSRKQRNFNYALVVCENAHGRLKEHDGDIRSVPTIVTACCVLHKFCEMNRNASEEAWICTQMESSNGLQSRMNSAATQS